MNNKDKTPFEIDEDGDIRYLQWGTTLGIGVGHMHPSLQADPSQNMFKHCVDNEVQLDPAEQSAGIALFSTTFEEILLVESYVKGQWGFPMGHRKLGDDPSHNESPISAAWREFEEETSLRIPEDALVMTHNPLWSDKVRAVQESCLYNQSLVKKHQKLETRWIESKISGASVYNWQYIRYTMGGIVRPKHITIYPVVLQASECAESMLVKSPEILQSKWVSVEQAFNMLCSVDSQVLQHGIYDLVYGLSVGIQDSSDLLDAQRHSTMWENLILKRDEAGKVTRLFSNEELKTWRKDLGNVSLKAEVASIIENNQDNPSRLNKLLGELVDRQRAEDEKVAESILYGEDEDPYPIPEEESS